MQSLLNTLMQIFIMLRHLVVEISYFKFDDNRVIRTGASDLKFVLGVVQVSKANQPLVQIIACWYYFSTSIYLPSLGAQYEGFKSRIWFHHVPQFWCQNRINPRHDHNKWNLGNEGKI